MALNWEVKQKEGQKGKDSERGRREIRERQLAKEVRERKRQRGMEA